MLLESPFEEALPRLRDRIKAFNKAKGIKDALLMGYHETMTHAWLHLVDFTMREHGIAESSDAFVDAQPQLTKKQANRFFYSKERFCSREAKESFVEPDLAALPVSNKPRAW